jgi:hypothetical protein
MAPSLGLTMRSLSLPACTLSGGQELLGSRSSLLADDV